jgi:hypothetical protein
MDLFSVSRKLVIDSLRHFGSPGGDFCGSIRGKRDAPSSYGLGEFSGKPRISHSIDNIQYSIIVSVVILSAVVPTMIAQKFFFPRKYLAAPASESIAAGQPVDKGGLSSYGN